MTDNIFNRPINGDITHYSSGLTEQRDPQELVGALDAALDIPRVEAIRWRQYTPYFNDGEPCEFSIDGVEFKFEGISEGGDYDDGFQGSWRLTYAHNDKRPFAGVEVSDDAVAVLKELTQAIEGGGHDIVLNRLFGDPAEVRATKDGFDVEYYEHD